MPQEFGGWFTSFNVEYLQGAKWITVQDLKIYPEMNLANSQWLKPSQLDYNISFKPVKTKGIRIKGRSGGIKEDQQNDNSKIKYFTAISELKVYSQ